MLPAAIPGGAAGAGGGFSRECLVPISRFLVVFLMAAGRVARAAPGRTWVSRLVPPSPAAMVVDTRDGPRDDPHESAGSPGGRGVGRRLAPDAVAGDQPGRAGCAPGASPPPPRAWADQCGRVAWVVGAG